VKKIASLTVLGLLLASVSPIASADTPKINTESFTIEAWIAPQAYPWNWAPVVIHLVIKKCVKLNTKDKNIKT